MEFNTHTFLLMYLPCVAIAYNLCPLRYRIILLTISSLAFYVVSGVIPAVLLIFSASTAYLFIFYIEKACVSIRAKKILFVLTCVAITSPFLVIKYLFPGAGWLTGFVEYELLKQISDSTSNILLPAGISFYTFQILSAVFDAKENKHTKTNFIEFLGFSSFFPQLIAGPIVKMKELMPQLHALTKRKRTNSEYINDMCYGLKLIAIGLLAKTFISDTLNTFYVSVDVDTLTVFDSVFIILSKSMMIFADFWGYSTMAIGLALLFGIKLPRNFLQPYYSHNIQEFWRRWHVTLNRWFFDYVYVRLGGRDRFVFAAITVFMLTGVWHGYGVSFLLWGFLHGVSLIIFVKFIKENKCVISIPAVSTLITFIWVSLLWVLFFFSLGDSVKIYMSLLNFDFTHGLSNTGIGKTQWAYLFLCIAIIFILDDDIFYHGSRHDFELTPSQTDLTLHSNENTRIKSELLINKMLMCSNCIYTVRMYITTIIAAFLRRPVVVPIVIMVSMLFFSYRTTFIYFRF